MRHIPVLLNEVLEYLDPKPGDKIIDATFSGGGHAEKILEKIKPNGKLLGIEIDTELFNEAKERFSKIKEIILVNADYRDLEKIVKENNFIGADGVLLDLGLSSWHFEESKRGFSFRKDELLDMRFTQNGELTAREIINQWLPEEIEKILKEYGEEKFARKITESIIDARKKKPIITTFQLVDVIKNAVPFWYQKKRRLNFATKTFQALRIAVNDELENLKFVLKQLPKVLKRGGRAAVISFHSLEDRIVKQDFKELNKSGIAHILTKKPINPSEEEIAENPRSRSAKLRVIEIL
ncbi:MAG: 16S rRNA (cytosine(1402)-N(4))-methyltransferase [Parcubacteria group bacterium RIFCSPLOWO2_01_FULL_40_65]|nr:MAG: 16S rRNA (cytosine(1402)-N(4))-methyltransferase [Parcubacteria group bacterium RIFCSPHIGHO2_01_FULL_40_30]OHB18781.1 MAG: 16S rRNA (cytosine(1402)-N(4))-methyltransferase [Parcubacteria group bacterium RIFCSPHIGHO2_02_FULL_40_12]OHB20997.1 MAG: 16S rRNA (cytosine(1402)-N(4))-methyltransferase [Parcubacteria group bacterium RIFCSPLOWO2_01_FULL_40_65]OHB22659.1 MAG: 16S rRNA (cytosine(1402)-N(4))-methyltransferase [Parcubacteria group bacterium RIFCSPLOWO2_02_FULL_40_12]OHB23986.1 MAG: 1